MQSMLTSCQKCDSKIDVDALNCPHCGVANKRIRTRTQPLFSQTPVAVDSTNVKTASSQPIQPLSPDAATAASGIHAKSTMAKSELSDQGADSKKQSAEVDLLKTETGVIAPTSLNAEEKPEQKVQAGDLLLDQYRVVKQLGEGGMGAVYLAVDDLSKQHVAVKVLPAALAQNADIRARFQLEAKALASLDHPAIVPLLIFSQRGGERYLVMKYVAGKNVESLLSEKKQLHPDEARVIFRTVISALNFAHRNGVIHRDVKPANVLQAHDGRIFLVDFGIAKQETGTNITQTGILMGTPQYMSPEQIRGQTIDGRSDLYAAGLLLYEMLCGQPPFMAEKTFAVLRSHVEDPVPDPQLFCSDPIPEDLRNVLSILLTKNPDERPATGQKVLDYLDGKIRFNKFTDFSSVLPKETHTPITQQVQQPDLTQAFLQAYDDDDLVLPKSRAPLFLLLTLFCILILGSTWTFRTEITQALTGEYAHKDEHIAAHSLLKKAQEALHKKDGTVALTLLEVHLADYPNDIEAQTAAGLALLLQNKRDEAQKILEKTRNLAKKQKDPASFAIHLANLKAAIDAHQAQEQQAKIDAKKARQKADEEKRKAAERARLRLPKNLTNAQLIEITDAKSAQKAKQLCWETIVLRKNPTASATVSFELLIENNGRVTKNKIINSTLNNKRFISCLDKVIKSWRFPRYRGPHIMLNHVTEFEAL